MRYALRAGHVHSSKLAFLGARCTNVHLLPKCTLLAHKFSTRTSSAVTPVEKLIVDTIKVVSTFILQYQDAQSNFCVFTYRLRGLSHSRHICSFVCRILERATIQTPRMQYLGAKGISSRVLRSVRCSVKYVSDYTEATQQITNDGVDQQLLAVWLLSQWLNFGLSKRIRIVELGPGRGTLMADILRVSCLVRHRQYDWKLSNR